MEVNALIEKGVILPKEQSEYAAGFDVRAHLSNTKITDVKRVNVTVYCFDTITVKNIIIHPGGRCVIPTGIKVAIPKGFEIVVRPRSGLAINHGVTVLNTPGTIDSDYRGEIGVILINHSKENFNIEDGDRIAQLCLRKTEHIHWTVVNTLPETKRGEGGFGSTDEKGGSDG